MEIRPYDPVVDYAGVESLWERTLGGSYPVPRRILLPRIGWRANLGEGDGWVAVEGGRPVGFAMGDHEVKAQNRLGFISCVLVDPSFQRRGIGTRLFASVEARLRAAGCVEMPVTGGNYRFWSGVPDDLPGACAFFRKQGIDLVTPVIDLVAQLEGEHLRRAMQLTLPDGITLTGASADDIGPLHVFQQAEFPGWVSSMSHMIAAGDIGNVLVMKSGAGIIGTIQTYTPGSMWRGANVVWERLLGERMGGYGCVGIGKAWRGRGLGLSICLGAMRHVAAAGGKCCLIDWTSLADFYNKSGAVVWRRFLRGSKRLN